MPLEEKEIDTEGRIPHEEAETQREEEGPVKMETGIGVMLPQTKARPGLPVVEKAKKNPPLEASEGGWPCLQTSSFQNGERINFCCFKPPKC